MPANIIRRTRLWLLLAVLALAVGVGVTAGGALAGRLTDLAGPATRSVSQQTVNSGFSNPRGPAFSLADTKRKSSTGASEKNNRPKTVDAFAHWVYSGTTPTAITVPVGTKLTMDLFINTGSNDDAAAQQSYMTF